MSLCDGVVGKTNVENGHAMKYRRAREKGGTYFFTVVTHKRKAILTTPDNIALLREAHRCVMDNHPMTIAAVVILPDHLHCIWTLPEGNCDFSTRWRLIKSYFSRNCDGRFESTRSSSRMRKAEQAIWQRRFWEHQIKDDSDFRVHCDYIHYNPVKHGLVNAPKDWPYSTFNRYVNEGMYDSEWGTGGELFFGDGVGME